MKILTKEQLQYLLEKKVQSDYVKETDMINLFDFFGDDYFRGHYTEPLELCKENPRWDEWRNEGRLPREGYKL